MRSGEKTRPPNHLNHLYLSFHFTSLIYLIPPSNVHLILGSVWNMSCFMFVTLNFDPSPTTLGSVWNMRSFVSVL